MRTSGTTERSNLTESLSLFYSVALPQTDHRSSTTRVLLNVMVSGSNDLMGTLLSEKYLSTRVRTYLSTVSETDNASFRRWRGPIHSPFAPNSARLDEVQQRAGVCPLIPFLTFSPRFYNVPRVDCDVVTAHDDDRRFRRRCARSPDRQGQPAGVVATCPAGRFCVYGGGTVR